MSYPQTARAQMVTVQGQHRYATLWEITKADGTVMRFTDHDMPVSFGGNTYNVAGGVDATSRESLSELAEANADVQGALTSDLITNEDIRSGQYDDALVIERVIDWLAPDVGGTLLEKRFWIGGYEYDAERWRAELLNLASFINHKVGFVYSRECRWSYGVNDGTVGCFGSVAPSATTVLSVTDRKRFFCGLTGNFEFGYLVWTSGKNAGISHDIRSSSGGNFVLTDPAGADIENGDTCDVYLGCDKTYTTCTARGQTDNYGGFVDMITDAKAFDGPTYSSGQ